MSYTSGRQLAGGRSLDSVGVSAQRAPAQGYGSDLVAAKKPRHEWRIVAREDGLADRRRSMSNAPAARPARKQQRVA